MEDGDVALFLQLALDLKAARCGDVLEVDAAEAAGDVVNGLDELVDVLRLHAEGDGVNAAERLEQDALALHDGHTGLRADVAQAEDGSTVGDDGAQVVAAGQLIGLVDVLLDLQTGLRNAGGVGQAEVVLRRDRDGSDDFDLALPLLVELQRLFCVIHDKLLLFFFDQSINFIQVILLFAFRSDGSAERLRHPPPGIDAEGIIKRRFVPMPP